MNNLNRQIIMQPKSIVAGSTMSSVGPQTASVLAVTENVEDLQYFPRATKKLSVQGTSNSSPSNLSDTVNVVFRAPVVSSSSNQSMRPPPPPPPKIKGHSEEPSSSIPDLGEFVFSTIFFFLLFLSLHSFGNLFTFFICELSEENNRTQIDKNQ